MLWVAQKTLGNSRITSDNYKIICEIFRLGLLTSSFWNCLAALVEWQTLSTRPEVCFHLRAATSERERRQRVNVTGVHHQWFDVIVGTDVTLTRSSLPLVSILALEQKIDVGGA